MRTRTRTPFEKAARELEADRRIYPSGELAARAVQAACLSTGAHLGAGDLIAAVIRTSDVPIGGWTGHGLARQVRSAAALMITRPPRRFLPPTRTTVLTITVLILAAMGLLKPLAQAALVLGGSGAVLAGLAAVLIGAAKSHINTTTTVTTTTKRGAL